MKHLIFTAKQLFFLPSCCNSFTFPVMLLWRFLPSCCNTFTLQVNLLLCFLSAAQSQPHISSRALAAPGNTISPRAQLGISTFLYLKATMTDLYLRVFSAELWLPLGTQSHLGVIFKMARLLHVLCALQTLLHCCSVEHTTVSTLLHTLLQCGAHYSEHFTAHFAAVWSTLQ